MLIDRGSREGIRQSKARDQTKFREIEKPTERLFKEKYGEAFPDMTVSFFL